MQGIVDTLLAGLQWLVDQLMNLVNHTIAFVWEVTLEALTAVLVLVVPNIDSNFSALAALDGFGWLIYISAIDYGLPAMGAALLGRFIVRRLPVVG